MKLSQLFYMGWWFFGARILGRTRPLQTVLFITDQCNLQCKHCSVYAKHKPDMMTYQQVREQLEYSYKQGSRFVDFEGGEVMLWRDGEYRINDLIDLATEVGFFSATITTNAQMPFKGVKAHSIWVSLDGVGEFHETIRGKGTFARLEKNIAECGHKDLSVNMVVNKYNHTSVIDTIEYVKNNPAIQQISINFYTPFPDAENMMIDWDRRHEVIDEVIALKRKGYPIMNSVSGLKLMKHNKFKRRCWVTNFIYANGERSATCIGLNMGICDDCGLCMAGEMNAVFSFKLDTIFAGLKLRG
ncbi:MAG: radical SAM protein [bacterium]